MRISQILLITLFLSQVAIAQDERLKGIEYEIEQLMDTFKTVGISVIVVNKEEVIYSKGFGYRDLEKKKPVTPNTVFGIGSISKQFMSGLIGIYEGRDSLSVYDRPAQYIDGLDFYMDEMDSLVNIEDLLTHQSGLGNCDASMVFFPTDDLLKNAKKVKYLEPTTDITGHWSYSNMGYSLLGTIAQEIGDRPWGDLITSEIFAPLGMSNSSTSIKATRANDNHSLPYSIRDGQPVEVLFDALQESGPGGAINSSANDMARWAQMLLNAGAHHDQQLIPKDYLERAFSNHVKIRDQFSFDHDNDILFDSYGYGWSVNNYLGHYRVQHGGALSGFTASLEVYPLDDLGIIVLSNQHNSNISFHVSDMIARRLLNKSIKPLEEYSVNVSQARPYVSH